MVREGALRGPFVAEHRPQDLLLNRVVAADHLGHPRGREHRHIEIPHELHQPAVVVGMGVGDYHPEQGLAQLIHPRAERAAIRDGQGRVDHRRA